MIAFAEQCYDDAVDNLYPIRSIAHRFDGSHAQRDVRAQILIESAIRVGQLSLASNPAARAFDPQADKPANRSFQAKTHKREPKRLAR